MAYTPLFIRKSDLMPTEAKDSVSREISMVLGKFFKLEGLVMTACIPTH